MLTIKVATSLKKILEFSRCEIFKSTVTYTALYWILEQIKEMKKETDPLHYFFPALMFKVNIYIRWFIPKLDQFSIVPTAGLSNLKDGDTVKVAGLVLVRQRLGTASGICFMTIEDETGFANLVVFEKLFEEFRKEIIQSKLIMVEGKLQIEGEVINVIVKRCHNFSKLLQNLTASREENPPVLTLAYPDEKSIPPGLTNRSKPRQVVQEKFFPEARNFK